MKYANISFKFRFDVCEVTTCRSGDFQTNTKTKEKEKYMYSGYELIWLFFCTSFMGWLLETVSAATHSWQKTMDQKFDDVRLKKIYPNALKVE